MSKELRLSSNKMLTGTAAGVAEYIGIEANLMRIIFAVSALVGSLGVWVYLIIWLVLTLNKK